MKDRTCPVCGNGKLREEVGKFHAAFEGEDGKVRSVDVENVTKYVCDSCEDYFLSEESEDRISAAQRRAMGLLGAPDLVRFREKLLKSQEGMAELLGLGKKTWCRWESNDHFQSEAFDRYIRLLMLAPSTVKGLELISLEKKGTLTPEALTKTFRYIADVPAAEEAGRKLQHCLEQGAFNSN